MGDSTSVTLGADTKDRLGLYRHPDYDSWDETLHAMMDVLPSVEDIGEGCTNPECDKSHFGEGEPLKERGGVIRFFTHHVDHIPEAGQDVYFDSNYYCSPDCAHEVDERLEAYLPEHPDLVVVGGKDEMRVDVETASFYKDGTTTEIGISVPGAFGGTSSHGREYEYVGEPVYVKNEGRWIETGVIDDIIHEETHTALLLDHDHSVTKEHHPE